MPKNDRGHTVGRAHLKHRGKGSHDYVGKAKENERGINENVPKGVRHGPGGPKKGGGKR